MKGKSVKNALCSEISHFAGDEAEDSSDESTDFDGNVEEQDLMEEGPRVVNRKKKFANTNFDKDEDSDSSGGQKAEKMAKTGINLTLGNLCILREIEAVLQRIMEKLEEIERRQERLLEMLPANNVLPDAG